MSEHQRLPNDIVQQIARQLESDQAHHTLSNLVLTSKTNHHTLAPLLYRHINLTDHSGSRLFQAFKDIPKLEAYHLLRPLAALQDDVEEKGSFGVPSAVRWRYNLSLIQTMTVRMNDPTAIHEEISLYATLMVDTLDEVLIPNLKTIVAYPSPWRAPGAEYDYRPFSMELLLIASRPSAVCTTPQYREGGALHSYNDGLGRPIMNSEPASRAMKSINTLNFHRAIRMDYAYPGVKTMRVSLTPPVPVCTTFPEDRVCESIGHPFDCYDRECSFRILSEFTPWRHGEIENGSRRIILPGVKDGIREIDGLRIEEVNIMKSAFDNRFFIDEVSDSNETILGKFAFIEGKEAEAEPPCEACGLPIY
ncbi:hypothetical protein CI109_101331 [Kwoniella shandongensis]|uniref:Uncharacterized protein n=1 Tax=Kwoniella shandongensis TaxID=1734106 RepID=A0A5M6BU16_9TREE|nr:uncharacterized protein CI109_005290 [Kwoniella shandongensis]KAA5526334.1 hypothetical protein CI109_005290 [Kwoniella shandongensis]